MNFPFGLDSNGEEIGTGHLRELSNSQVLNPAPTDDGTNVVFYTQALLDAQLGVRVRFQFDDFEPEPWLDLIDVAPGAVQLPAFAVTSSLLGPVGAALSPAVVRLAKGIFEFTVDLVGQHKNANYGWYGDLIINVDSSRAGFDRTPPGGGCSSKGRMGGPGRPCASRRREPT